MREAAILGVAMTEFGNSEKTNIDGVVKSLHILRYSGWPWAWHTTCFASRLGHHYGVVL
jgi:hypothetical protein